MISKVRVSAPDSIGISLRISKGVPIEVRQRDSDGGAWTDLGDPITVTPRGLLTQSREWHWEKRTCEIEVFATEDADIHAIHILQPPDPRQAPKKRIRRARR